MKTSHTLLSALAITIVAVLSVGFVSPQEVAVLDYSNLLGSFYGLVAVGLAGVGLLDLKNQGDLNR